MSDKEHTFPMYYEEDKIVLCDLDGTLCDVDHRRHFVNGDKKYFDEFNAALVDDNLREEVYDLLRDFMSQNKVIVFLSGRPNKYRPDTVDWLEANGFPKRSYDFLLMRNDNDSRPDQVIKKEIFEAFFKPEWIHVVIDDRPKVIRMWRAMGLDVIDVGDGIDF